MVTTSAPGDELAIDVSSMKWVWAVVFFIVAVFGGFLTEWQALEHLLEGGGSVGTEGASLIAFVAGYTLPLMAGSAIAALVYLRGGFADMEPRTALVVVAAILFVAGVAATYFGLGLLPDYEYSLPSGPPYVSIPLWVLQGYFNTYGWSLMLSAVAIGVAVALHVDAWYRQQRMAATPPSSQP